MRKIKFAGAKGTLDQYNLTTGKNFAGQRKKLYEE